MLARVIWSAGIAVGIVFSDWAVGRATRTRARARTEQRPGSLAVADLMGSSFLAGGRRDGGRIESRIQSPPEPENGSFSGLSRPRPGRRSPREFEDRRRAL